jgi:hypothetical protein
MVSIIYKKLYWLEISNICYKMSTRKKLQSRSLFTEHEDNLIKHLYEELGIRDWNQIAQYLPTRSPQKCRDRYLHCLQPNLTTKALSKEEDDKLANLVKQYGKTEHYFRISSRKKSDFN